MTSRPKVLSVRKKVVPQLRSARESGPETAATSKRGTRSGWWAQRTPAAGWQRWGAFPFAVLVAFVVLVGLDLNGSSIALLSSDPHPAGLLAGTPRPIRADEWIIETPIAIGDVRQNLPDSPWIGLAPVDQVAAAHGGPTTQWPTLLKPQSWGYLVLGAGRGLAVSWWWPFAICLLGCYALLCLVTRRALLSSALAVVATFTPYAGWWTAPSPSLFLGYIAAAAACLLAAWSVRRRLHAVMLAVLAGLFVAAFALALYPPWQISLGIVVVALCGGWALDSGVRARRFLATVAIGLGVAGGAITAWYLQNLNAIRAQADTIYPGHHLNASGSATWAGILDAPLNFWMTGPRGATLHGHGGAGTPANLSEAASSWLPLPVIAIAVLGVVETLLLTTLRRRPDNAGALTRSECRWTSLLVSAAALLLLAWALVPLPSFVGRITELQRVEPYRTQLSLGFACVVLIALLTRRGGRQPVVWRWPLLVVATAATGATAYYADVHLPWTSRVPTSLAVASGLVMGAAFAALLRRRSATPAAVVLAIYAVVSWVPINPLQRGIMPVTRDVEVRALKAATSGTHNPRTLVFVKRSDGSGTALTLVAKVRASGLQSLSGTTLYPDAGLMRNLTPGQTRLWNNYAQYRWFAGPAGRRAQIEPTNGTQMSLIVSPCDPILLAGARPGWAISDTALRGSCLTRVSTRTRSAGRRLWIYRVADS